MWQWEENSILYNMTKYTSTRDIFQAVCNEIGRYYKSDEMKYTKSNRKLKWRGNKVWCEFGFWSSHSNMSGSWVALEIVTYVHSIDKAGMEKDGFVNCDIRSEHFNVYNIDDKKFFEIIDYIDGRIEMSKLLESQEGLEKFFVENSKQEFIKRHPNNLKYLNKIGFTDIDHI